MAFFEQQFDPRLTMGARGGPAFSTQRAYTAGGKRQANRNWSAPLHRYDVSQCIKTATDFASIRAMFYNVSGAFDGFRFKDWQDYQVSAAQSAMTLITGSTYQMGKNYTIGARTYTRSIVKPVAGALIFRTRSSVTTDITGSSTVDTTTGQVTVTGHVGGDTYTWSGTFDVPVAFMKDEFDPEVADIGGGELLIRWGSIQLEELR